jgi:hypothetical protein
MNAHIHEVGLYVTEFRNFFLVNLHSIPLAVYFPQRNYETFLF